MKAISKLHDEPGLWLVEEEIPQIGPLDLLIKIRKTGICGSDVHFYKWDSYMTSFFPLPVVVGHEYVGEVVEVGAQVQGYQVGDRVTGEGHIACGQCKACQTGNQHLCSNGRGVGSSYPGAFAEYLRLPASNAIKLPDEISDDYASILDPLGNAVHAALMYDIIAKDVLISGAGPIGIMAAAVAQFVGARRVVLTDFNPYRLELARKVGVQHTVDLNQQTLKDVITDLKIQEGFDVGLEMSGASAAFMDQLNYAVTGGNVAVFGFSHSETIDFPMNMTVLKGLTIKGIFGRIMFKTWRQVIGLIDAGLDVTPVITHHLPAEDFNKGFELLVEGQAGKVVLEWD